ncbi:ABC transporter substrate-binding protein (plasmid) [Rhizobium sp. TRM96647]|uniref:ABC transporter substrate-binding protein n=1 Tax=unclassified Rhizobium TaxID=2613769 RepID=UPI0021E854B5|nr:MULTISPECIES: ABC transporter substrate-binding protein [unclassified Rhizobium]MCV3735163.1 ABC transporter substrate-binding protein [Rhizobium sp. TRM96647]MCV3758073.1 ABC transporter substrate-binding protein [Rhizobium sp. TRM96650]
MKYLKNHYKRLAAATLMAVSVLGPAAAGQALAEDVKLGLLVGFTGDMGPWAPALNNAAVLAVEEINDAGGILGNKVVLISEDNASSVNGAVRGAQKLASVDKVSAIIGPESDPIVALMQFAKDNKLPIISTSAGTEALDKVGGKGNYIYRTNASDSFLGVVHAKMLLDEIKANEVAVVVENLEGTVSGADTFIRNYEKFGGKVVKKIVLTSGQSSYLNEIRDLASVDPKQIFLAVGQTAGVNFVKQAYQRGYDWKWWVTAELQSPDFVKAAGVEVVKGFMNPVSSQTEGAESWKRFSDAYEQRFGEKPEPGFYQAETYDAFIATALAMEAAGATTGEAVDSKLTDVAGPGGEKVVSFADGVKAIREGKDIDLEGASGSLDFNENGNVTVPATRVLQVNDAGEWVAIKTVDSSAFPAN